MPPAEEHLDPDRVRTLLRQQCPDLAERPLVLLANGWDNTLLLLGEDLLVRLPRRAVAARLLAHEQRWLPGLSLLLPLPVPTPVRFGRPGAGYPWPWSVTAYLPGVDAGHAEGLDTGEAAGLLGDFLAVLHRPAPLDAPRNPVRGVALRQRDVAFRGNLELAGAAMDATEARAIWQTALAAAPWTRPPVWLHGDLHPANLLVRDTHLAAVLDFGDLGAGDPATDLAVAWMVLPREHRPRFWRAYAAAAGHGVDADLRSRSRGWAIAFAAVFLAHSADNPSMAQIGRRTAAAVLDEGTPPAVDIHRP